MLQDHFILILVKGQCSDLGTTLLLIFIHLLFDVIISQLFVYANDIPVYICLNRDRSDKVNLETVLEKDLQFVVN